MAHDQRKVRLDQNEDEHVEFPRSSGVRYNGLDYLVRRSSQDVGRFSLLLTEWSDYSKKFLLADTYADGIVYQPPHPSMTEEDIEGATYAYDDGTHWLFAHCSPLEQINFAAEAQAFTVGEFALALTNAQTKADEATNAVALAKAVARVKGITALAESAGNSAHRRVVDATLGYYHKNPHNDHLRDLAVASIEAVLSEWAKLALTDTQVANDLRYARPSALTILARLKKDHTIEWRHERQERLDDAEAAGGTDPVAGHEYIYTRSLTAATITGDANLPDPDWDFDQLRVGDGGSGPQTRGSFIYQDDQPETNAFVPWVIRFRRPIPHGTQKGTDIGSVAWEQETAYKPS